MALFRLLTVYMLSIFYCRSFFLSSTAFLKLAFQKIVMNMIRGLDTLDQDQARRFVGPDLDPNCLQRLSAHDKSLQ